MFSDDDERVEDWLRDIIENGDWIATYLSGLTFEQFVADRKTGTGTKVEANSR